MALRRLLSPRVLLPVGVKPSQQVLLQREGWCQRQSSTGPAAAASAVSAHVAAGHCAPAAAPTTRKRRLHVYSVEERLVPYAEAWGWQQALLRQRMAWQREGSEGCDALILLEHPSVYTLGRGSTADNLKFDPSAPGCPHELYRIERGGEVTWHGPGQIVGYPIVDLSYHKKDLHWYLRALEEVVLRVLARRGVQGVRDPDNTGVWVGDRKYAAIGLNASRWVTTHGFALNVRPDMAAFENIVPCGIADKGVGCLADGDAAVRLEDVRQQVLEEFCTVFSLAPEDACASEIPPLSPGDAKLLRRLS